jgi:hypothetical protein
VEEIHMGFAVHYTYFVACPEEELQQRLGRGRERLLGLGLPEVSEVTSVEPAYDATLFRCLEQAGVPFPPAVAERLGGALADVAHNLNCLTVVPSHFWRLSAGLDMQAPPEVQEQLRDLGWDIPRALRQRYLAPARDLAATTDLWDENSLPEQVSNGQMAPVRRAEIALEFAAVLLRRAYLLWANPGPGAEWVSVSLATLGGPEPLWHGRGFTKPAHGAGFDATRASIHAILDCAAAEGVLHSRSEPW